MIRGLLPGAAALAFILAIVGGAIGALIGQTAGLPLREVFGDGYLRRVVFFTLYQATLSTLLSLLFALPVARALARRDRFPGREALLRLMGLPMVTPTIVAVFGILAVYGRSGLLNRILEPFGLSYGEGIYGLTGILVAHVFFNMPLAARMLLGAWERIPAESWRLTSQIGMSGPQIFRLIEWPALRAVLPGVGGVVFLLCFVSFAVVLVLGGGPRATTIEVAIYQALHFDFEPQRAVVLAVLQLALCALMVGVGQRFTRSLPVAAGLSFHTRARPDREGISGRVLDTAVIAAGSAYVGLPLAAIVLAGLSGPVLKVVREAALWQATLRSLVVAFCAGGLALLCGWALLWTSRRLRLVHGRNAAAEGLEMTGSLTLVIPPMVLGAGLFVLLMPVTGVFSIGLQLVALINALMTLPYVIRTVGPALLDAGKRYDRLCTGLGVQGWHRFRLVDWPLLRRPTAFALALCTALSFGDVGAIALFGTQDTMTLPLLLYQRMGSYRFGEAAVTALFLLGLCLGVFFLIERGLAGRNDVHRNP